MVEVISKPDVDEILIASQRKHLKKLLTTTEYLQKYCRWNYYKPHPETQLPFHDSPADERSIVLGNQQGKTHAASFELAFQACDVYPPWYKGRRHVVPKIERPQKFIGWYASISSQAVRDNAQLKLLGDISQKDGLGTGAIPLDYIEHVTMSRGIANFVDTATLRRETGGHAILQSKTYEQSVLAYQGTPVDLAWVDEDMGYDDRIYGELLARTFATGGRIIVSLTPMLGMTPIRKRFTEGGPNIFQVRGGLQQALHIPESRHASIIARVPANQRAARIEGREMQGSGAVFTIPVSQVKYERAPELFPAEWPVCWGCDFSHGGMSDSAHPFVAAFAFYDKQSDVIYIADIIVMHQQLPDQHVMRIKQHPCWDAPFLWPHDGSRVGDMKSGDTIAHMYRRLGLKLSHEHVTFAGGGYSLEAGIAEMERRFASGRLLVAKHLGSEFDPQYQNYHYEDGKVVRRDDDVLDAIRVVVMGIRHAKPQSMLEERRYAQRGARMCTGVDFDVFTGRAFPQPGKEWWER